MIRVRLIKKFATVLNGIDVSSLAIGDVIELPDSAARMMVAEGWAKPVTEPIEKRPVAAMTSQVNDSAK